MPGDGLSSGYIAFGKAIRIAMPIADPIAATSRASATTQACGFFALASSWASPRLRPSAASCAANSTTSTA